MRALRLVLPCAALTVAAACNAIFGVQPGVGGGPGPASGGGGSTSVASSGSVASSTGTGGSATASSSSGSGGAPACPADKIPPCHVDGGAGAICDAVSITGSYDGYAIGLAVVGDTVYWASGNGKITYGSTQGSVGANAFGNGSDSVMAVTDGQNIYWTDWNDATIRGASLSPGNQLVDVASMVAADAGPMPRALLGRIALRAGQLYWAGEYPSAIWTAKADGTQVYATKVADKVDDTESTEVSIGVAVDDAHIYWTDDGAVRRLPLDKIGDSSAIEPFASDPGAGEVMVDETRVYWTSSAGVASKKKDGTGLVVLPVAGARARSLLLDGGYVYWSESGGRIVRAQKGGGTSTVSVVSQGTPDAYMMAADCGAIYWSTFAYNHGSIYKVRKPD
ncbi:MAG: hypothetical protein QM820_65020 [Minicystis sp.]